MTTILLLIIYLIFISLGLPDSVIGTAWPAISMSLGISEDLQGVITCLTSFFTIISSFFTPFIVKKIRAYGTVTISIVLTAIGLLIFSFSPNFYIMLIATLPLGLGAGAIDACLNNYVALHYKALHMNWLHSFWGIGATLSPFIVGFFIGDVASGEVSDGWRTGLLVLSIMQAVIFFISLISFKVWKKSEIVFNSRESNQEEKEIEENISYKETFKLKGLTFALIAFLSYIAVESLTGMWFSSYLYFGIGEITEQDASYYGGLFYLGIAVGRFVAGLLSLKINERNMIRIGEITMIIGIILLFMTFEVLIMPVAVLLIGLGCAPVYPGVIKDTPRRFGTKYSQSVMSIQVSFAYISNFLIAPLFGVVAKVTTFKILPFVLIFFFLLLVFGNEITNYKVKNIKYND